MKEDKKKKKFEKQMRKSENKTKRHESSKVIILTRDIDPCLTTFLLLKKISIRSRSILNFRIKER